MMLIAFVLSISPAPKTLWPTCSSAIEEQEVAMDVLIPKFG